MSHDFGRQNELRKQREYAKAVEQSARGYRNHLASNRRAIALDAAWRNSPLTPMQQTLKGALLCYVGPRLANDENIPDLNQVVEGVDRKTPRRMIADRLRRAVRGRLAKDADMDDIEALLKALEEEGYDPDDEGEDDVEAEAATDPADCPWPEAKDRRRAMGKDIPPDFPGRPLQGSMSPMSGKNDTRFPGSNPPDPAAKDRRLPHQRRSAGDVTRPRHFGASDAAPQRGSFADRFRFTRGTVPGYAGDTKKLETM